jgi:acetyl-CoA C-acetyltransferase
VIAHANGVNNPNAMFRKAISPQAYQKSGVLNNQLNLFDIAPMADGAAAVILTRPQLLPPGFPHPLIRIAGSSMATDTLALHDRPDPLNFRAAQLSVKKACQKARISPLQVDFFELYDAYSIYAVLALEAAGFAQRGEGWKLAQPEEGLSALSLQGTLPISTMGGLKARGNPCQARPGPIPGGTGFDCRHPCLRTVRIAI